MAQLVLGTAGAVVGYFASGGNPYGAYVGWAIGSGIGARIGAKDQKVQGARLNDLKLPGVQYGDTIPYIRGRFRTAGQVWWASVKREIVTVTNQDAGGKGGGPTVEQTTFTYEIDLLIGLTDNEIAGVPRVWENGKLVYNILSSEAQAALLGVTEDAAFTARAEANVSASANTPAWRRITVYLGTNTQLPDPTYEAAVGSANAVAYRNRAYVFIEGLQLGAFPAQLPNLEFEVCTKAAAGEVDANVLFQLNPATDGFNDISSFALAPTIGADISIVGGFIEIANGASGTDAIVTYPGTSIDGQNAKSYTFEYFVKLPAPSGLAGQNIISEIDAPGGEIRIKRYNQAGFPGASGHLAVDLTSTEKIRTADPAPSGILFHLCHMFQGSEDGTETSWLFVNGDLQATLEDGFAALPTSLGQIALGGAAPVGAWQMGEVRLKLGLVYNTAGFTPPDGFDDPDAPTDTLTPQDEDLDDVVSALCVKAGLTAAQIDVTDLATVRDVRGIAVSQVTPTRGVLEMLMTSFFFEAVCSDKIYFRRRASASLATIPYEDLGASMGGQNVEPLALKLNSDIEIPAQFALTYANLNADYQPDTQFSDRLVTAVDESVSTIQLPIVLIPSEAKLVVDAIMTDQAVSAVGTKISLLGEYTAHEPTDVVNAEDEDGNQYRLRLVRKTDTYPLLEFEAVVDDATVVESEQVTSDDYTPAIDVDEPSATVIELMDIPIGRDLDDDSGFYVAAKGDPAPWPGCALMKSSDDIAYSSVLNITESAVIGTASNALGDWDGPRIFDELSSITVDVGEGTLTSSTRSAVLASKLTNCMLIGSEIVQFVTATLISTGTYTLTRLLRGCRGTEWAMTGHATGDRCVLLRQTGGVRRVSMENAELGLTRYYAGVTFGRTLSSALTGSPAGGEAFVNNAVGLKPFAPVDLRVVRDSSNDITGTFKRRTRLSTRFAGTLGINVPLGEDSEAYEIDVFPVGSPNALLRTIEVTDESFSYSAANQTTDGATPGDEFVWKVYQISATVDRGYALEKTA